MGTKNLKPFPKGVSGNPKGRPPKLPALDKLMADVLGEEKDGVTAAEAILKRLRSMAAAGNLKAAEILLDRGYGKPKHSIDHTGTLPPTTPQVTVVVQPPTRTDG